MQRRFCLLAGMFFFFYYAFQVKCRIVDSHLCGDILVSSLLFAADTVLLADNAKDMKRSLQRPHTSCESRRRVQVDIDCTLSTLVWKKSLSQVCYIRFFYIKQNGRLFRSTRIKCFFSVLSSGKTQSTLEIYFVALILYK